MILSKLAWRKGDKTSICKIWIRTTTFFQHITSYSSNKTSKEKKSLGHYYPKPFGPDYWKVLRTDEITKEFLYETQGSLLVIFVNLKMCFVILVKISFLAPLIVMSAILQILHPKNYLCDWLSMKYWWMTIVKETDSNNITLLYINLCTFDL